MSNKNPYWLELLGSFERKGYVHNGLTIPFLIGTLEVIEPGTKLLKVGELIKQFDEYGCTILHCSSIDEFVIGTLDQETRKIMQKYNCLSKQIVITDSSLENISDSKGLEELFVNKYEQIIYSRKFSKNNGEWSYFTKEEIDRINEIMI